ncbi:MAG: hypothetical protein H0W49_12260 [Nitrospirales bacterium]|nr:hypothetical protein [Nitrospirales bacterium]
MYPNGYPTGMLEMANKSQNVLKTEISVSIQVVIFKKNGKSTQHIDGIEVA